MPTIRNVQQPVAGLAGSTPTGPYPAERHDITSAEPITVLLVEDDFLLRTVSVSTLADLGYKAYEVPDARQALSMLTDNDEINVLITDVNLPGMDGKALANEARRIRPGIRVLFVTGYSQKAVKDFELKDGCTGYLSKPYQHNDLDRALRRLLM